jgi:hypothetical protein
MHKPRSVEVPPEEQNDQACNDVIDHEKPLTGTRDQQRIFGEFRSYEGDAHTPNENKMSDGGRMERPGKPRHGLHWSHGGATE